MGLDWLDIAFRIEKSFGIPFDGGIMQQAVDAGLLKLSQRDMTSGDLHALVCKLVQVAGLPVPDDSWDRLRTCIADATGVDRDEIHPHSWMRRDLGVD